jgi:uncharacterized protein YjbI with pentapeptide repeats
MSMADSWPTCDEDGCSGARTGDETRCLTHAGADERGATLKRFSEGEELDVRGVTISSALFGEIFNAVPNDADGHPTFPAARFDGATFEGDARFDGATFEGDAGFDGARFKGDAGFDGATFEGAARFTSFTSEVTFEGDFEVDAWFDGTTFEGAARFDGATFKGDARFDGARFKGDAVFVGATFEGAAVFTSEKTFKGDFELGGWRVEGEGVFSTGATFKGDARFTRATFKGDARFDGARFKGDARFDGATFEKGGARFVKVTFEGDAGFTGATFEGDVAVLGPIAVVGRLALDGVQFTLPVRIEADANVLTCRRGRFPGGVRFDVYRADVCLDDSDLSAPSLLTGPAAAAVAASRYARMRAELASPAGSIRQPRLLSLQRANVAGLALGNVDLAGCRFTGAHNLDKLRLEAGAVFGLSPAVAGWERRQVIAEESAWRAAPRDWPRGLRVTNRTRILLPRRRGRWIAPPPDAEDGEPEVLSPGAVAVLYRALRKSREDAKDEPGAADFYYGEMEMRRHDRRGKGHATGGWSRGLVSRGVLTAYWLVSGYGLRAWRSLAALAVVMAVSAGVFRLWGFTHSISYWKSLLFAFRSTLSLTDAQVNLTAWGGLFQAILRLTGPVLLALTLLALRGRVKR